MTRQRTQAGGGAGELRDEVVGLARELIRIDTSNPPGNETAAARLLKDYLEDVGIGCELAGPDPQRLNLVARIEGRGEGPSLMLLAHTDVVPAPPANWTVPPFEGVERDGSLIGRGAVDMKSELAARAVALASFARSGALPAGDLVLVAEADEERNTADVGMSWLVRERPEVVCDFALNEGGGVLLELANGRRVVTVSVGEKQVTSLRIRVRGVAGHASIPTATENPLQHLGIAIERLLTQGATPRITPALARALTAMGAPGSADRGAVHGGDGETSGFVGDAEKAVSWAAGQHPVLADLMPAMSRLTVTPTGTRTDQPANVIPPYADLICDCRALPGQGEADIRGFVERALGTDFEFEVELLEPLEGGTESPLDTPLLAVLERYVAERVPGGRLLPIVTPGFTDSHWVRGSHRTIAYGFAPILFGDPSAYTRAAHAADEAISIDDLAEMAAFHLRAIREFSGGGV